MSPLVLSGCALVLLGAALWCLRETRHLTDGAVIAIPVVALMFGVSGAALGAVLHRLLEVLP